MTTSTRAKDEKFVNEGNKIIEKWIPHMALVIVGVLALITITVGIKDLKKKMSSPKTYSVNTERAVPTYKPVTQKPPSGSILEKKKVTIRKSDGWKRVDGLDYYDHPYDWKWLWKLDSKYKDRTDDILVKISINGNRKDYKEHGLKDGQWVIAEFDEKIKIDFIEMVPINNHEVVMNIVFISS